MENTSKDPRQETDEKSSQYRDPDKQERSLEEKAAQAKDEQARHKEHPGRFQGRHQQEAASEGSGTGETTKRGDVDDAEDTQSNQSEDPTRKSEANQGASDLRKRDKDPKRNPEERRRDASDKTNDFRDRERP